MVWRLGRLDLGGPWGWGELDGEHLERLHTVMSEFEASTPRILRVGSKLRDIPPEDLCRGAQQRLLDIAEDDTIGLSELRLGHKKWRVWGFLTGSMFDVLWWDPEHTVCPELPKGMTRW